MIVDPSTGQPLSLSQPSSFAFAGAGDLGLDATQNPGIFAALSHTPSITTSMGWNAFRGGNTILRGGYAADPMTRWRFFGNQFHPRSFGRMASIYGVDNSAAAEVSRTFGKGTRKLYSPFNFLGSAPEKFPPNPNQLMNWAKKTQGVNYFSPGFFSRQNAAQRIINGAKFNSEAVMGNLGRLDPGIGKLMTGAPADFASSLSKEELSQFTAASMNGTLSLKASGYMSYLRSGAPTERVLSKFGTDEAGLAAKESFVRGGERAAASLAKGNLEKVGSKLVYNAGQEGLEKFGLAAAKAGISDALASEGGAIAAAQVGGALGVEAAGLAIPVVNVALAAKMAFDVGKMVSGAATSLMSDAKDAMVSFKGSIGKPIMGMGYKDTTVAATSRQRGVMAIQASKLNARSVLGSEAGGLAAHFG